MKEKKRIIVFEVRITVWTDFLLELFSSMVRLTFSTLELFAIEKKYTRVKFEIQERLLDGKTFAEIEK